MDDPDLQLLRRFRQDEASPPEGLQARIEERLWQAILAEESAAAGTSRPSALRSWYERLLRPAVAAGTAATIAIGVAVAGGGGDGGPSSSVQSLTRAGVLDGTATSLFGEPAATAHTGAPIQGSIDLRSPEDMAELARGPRLADDGKLDDKSREVIRETTRDPIDLQAQLRAGAAATAGSDPSDRVAFEVAMQWVVAPEVPSDLRAAMLRSLAGLSGVDVAIMGVDLLGRQGIVLGHLDSRTGIRTQYLLEVDGGRLLERRAFTTGYVDPACPPGTFTDHALHDEQGMEIQPADAPWLAWPPVVASCDPGS